LKLLFDQNLSPGLPRLANEFPGSVHVRDVGLARALDREVWEYARQGGFCLVSKDEDFHQMSFLEGAPPKVIWLRLGNCTVEEVALRLVEGLDRIGRFEADPDGAFLILGGGS
jgi:predicted nuclease of predicted toxin-antitoxin system